MTRLAAEFLANPLIESWRIAPLEGFDGFPPAIPRVVASASDLLRYHQALRGGALLSEDSWETMRRVEPGIDNGLAYLIMTGPAGDHEGNAGRSMGHVSASIYYIERDLFIVMMLNRGDTPLPMARFLELRYGPA